MGPVTSFNPILTLDKFTDTEAYSHLKSLTNNEPTSQKYFQEIFLNDNFDWKKIYIQTQFQALFWYRHPVTEPHS